MVPRELRAQVCGTDGRGYRGQKLLDRLYREGRSKDFLLAYFCTDEPTCHRSVVGGLLLGAGAAISCDEEYRRYFTIFREALSKARELRPCQA